MSWSWCLIIIVFARIYIVNSQCIDERRTDGCGDYLSSFVAQVFTDALFPTYTAFSGFDVVSGYGYYTNLIPYCLTVPSNQIIDLDFIKSFLADNNLASVIEYEQGTTVNQFTTDTVNDIPELTFSTACKLNQYYYTTSETLQHVLLIEFDYGGNGYICLDNGDTISNGGIIAGANDASCTTYDLNTTADLSFTLSGTVDLTAPPTTNSPTDDPSKSPTTFGPSTSPSPMPTSNQTGSPTQTSDAPSRLPTSPPSKPTPAPLFSNETVSPTRFPSSGPTGVSDAPSMSSEDDQDDDPDGVLFGFDIFTSIGLICMVIVLVVICPLCMYCIYVKTSKKNEREEDNYEDNQLRAKALEQLEKGTGSKNHLPSGHGRHVLVKTMSTVPGDSHTDHTNVPVTGATELQQPQGQKNEKVGEHDSDDNSEDDDESLYSLQRYYNSAPNLNSNLNLNVIPFPALPQRPKSQMRLTYVGDVDEQLISAIGQPLIELAMFESVQGYESPVPKVLVLLEQEIYNHRGYKTTGIFNIDVMKQQPNKKCFIAARKLLTFFGNLPDEEVVVGVRNMESTSTDDMQYVIDQLEPPCNMVLLFIWNMCARIAVHSKRTEMDTPQLAEIFGPLLTMQDDDTSTLWFAQGIEWRMTINK